MNSQELRALQEAYSQVYELDEEDKTGYGIDTYASKKYFGDKEKQEKLMRRMNRLSGKKQKTQQEQVDLYDIILSHLLDEGYADTEQAAEAIMVNMSDDWRESICEADSLADFQARREKRRAAMKKKTGYGGHDYSKPAKGGGYLDALDRERESGKKD